MSIWRRYIRPANAPFAHFRSVLHSVVFSLYISILITGYRWHDYVSNDLVLMEAGLRQVTCIVRERQLRHYGHVARLPAEDPALRILSRRNPRGWTMPSGRQHAPCLRHVESYFCGDRGMAGLASAWAMARRRPKEYRRKVDAAMRCSGACFHV